MFCAAKMGLSPSGIEKGIRADIAFRPTQAHVSAAEGGDCPDFGGSSE
jgi:hypothetical protein